MRILANAVIELAAIRVRKKAVNAREPDRSCMWLLGFVFFAYLITAAVGAAVVYFVFWQTPANPTENGKDSSS